jgi:ABC-type glycerol-3-phosphate transport system substrate-binding protein
MNRRVVWTLTATGAVLIALAAFLLGRLALEPGDPKPAGRVRAFLHLYTSPQAETLARLLDEFASFYSDIDLEYRIAPYQDLRAEVVDALAAGVDAAVVTSLAGRDLEDSPRPLAASSPWTSLRWGLFYDRDRLSEAGWTESGLAELSDRGLDAFVEALTPALRPGEALFSLGTTFDWPWLGWVQHLQLVEADGRLPDSFEPSRWAQGIAAWQDLRDSGLFNADYRDRNWAESVYAISEGRALFVLSDTTIYGAYTPSSRGSLAMVPFPGSAAQGWQVGSSFYLGLILPATSDAELSAAGNELLRYLHSEGVRSRFLEATGTALLPRTPVSGLREFPSLTQRARELDLRDLIAAGLR